MAMKEIATADAMSEGGAQHSSAGAMRTGSQVEPIIDCPVCLYWSHRLESSRTNHPSTEPIREKQRLLAILKTHQLDGACARRLPYLMDLLAEPKGIRTN